MISVRTRPFGRPASLLLGALCAILATGLLARVLSSWVQGSAIVPVAAAALWVAGAHLGGSSRRWHPEAALLAGSYVLFGPMAALLAGGSAWLLSGLSLGRRAYGRGEVVHLCALGASIALAWALSRAGVASGAALGTAIVFVWLGGASLLKGAKPEALMPIVASAGLAMAMGGLCDREFSPLAALLLVPALLMLIAVKRERESAESHRETLEALALMLRRAHPYTHAHIERVGEIAERTALHLGLSPSRAQRVGEAARLHDVGKIAVDEAILDKPGSLTKAEYEHVKLHALFGASILEEDGELLDIAEWIRFHHERPDGLGYPSGLRGDQTPIEARIIAVADAYDAMTGGYLDGERRPYRDPLSPARAVAELERCAGSQFDARVVTAFKQAIREGAER